MFWEDLYTDKKIVKDNVVPEEFIYKAKGYLKELSRFLSSKKIRTHINGIDLVKDTVSDKWVILAKITLRVRVELVILYQLEIHIERFIQVFLKN